MDTPLIQQILLAEAVFFFNSLILISALVLAYRFPLGADYQPLKAFSLLAALLASKVNHNDRAPNQQFTAGLLASLLLIFPFWAIISFLLSLAAYPWFFEFLFLYLCLSANNFSPTAKDIVNALNNKRPAAAKVQLKDWVTHDTLGLSEVGISKASIAQLLMRPGYGTVSGALFFAIGGVPLVLGACMFRQLELSWPPYTPAFKHFSRFIYRVNRLLFWLPTKMWNFSLAIQGGVNGLKALLAPRKTRQALNGFSSLYIGSQVLQIELGGPQKLPPHFSGALKAQNIKQPDMYRLELDKIKSGKLPEKQDISLAIKLTSQGQLFWISFILLIPVFWGGLRWLQQV
jgi:adenosylcobinamide-phosphate synthase